MEIPFASDWFVQTVFVVALLVAWACYVECCWLRSGKFTAICDVAAYTVMLSLYVCAYYAFNGLLGDVCSILCVPYVYCHKLAAYTVSQYAMSNISLNAIYLFTWMVFCWYTHHMACRRERAPATAPSAAASRLAQHQQPPASGTAAAASWPRVFTSPDGPQRVVPVASASVDHNMAAAYASANGTSLLFPLALRTHQASKGEQPTVASPGTLFGNSEFFRAMLPSDNPSSTFQDVTSLASSKELVLSLDVPQEALRAVIASLYTGSLALNGDLVETYLLIAQYLRIECVEAACADYILNDILTPALYQAANKASALSLPVVKVVHLAGYCPALMPQVISQLVATQPWCSKTTATVLEECFELHQATQVIMRLRQEAGYTCESQVGLGSRVGHPVRAALRWTPVLGCGWLL